MKTAVIVLPESCEDRNKLLLKKYQFSDGELHIPILSDKSTDHIKIGGLLCRYYGCSMSTDETAADEIASELAVEEAEKAAAAKLAADEEAAEAAAAKLAAEKDAAEAAKLAAANPPVKPKLN